MSEQTQIVNLEKQGINLEKHMNELNEYEKILKHANALLYNLSSQKQDSWDRNDIYELRYIITELELLIKDELVNSDIKTSAKAILQKLKIIDLNIQDEKLKDILNRPLKSLGKINKAKYGKRHKYKGLKDPSEKTVKYESPVKYYFQQRIVILIMLGIILFVLNSGMIPSVFNTLLGTSTNIEESNTNTEKKDTSNSEDKQMQETMNVSKEALRNVVEQFSGSLSVLLNIMLCMITSLIAIKTVLDLMYISVPAVRAVSGETFTSSEAKQAIEYSQHQYVVEGKIINSDDRFETSKALLHIMLNPETHKIVKDYNRAELIIKKIDPDKIENRIGLTTTKKLTETLEGINSRIKLVDEYNDKKNDFVTKTYVQDLVYCEMLYQCLSIVETYRG